MNKIMIMLMVLVLLAAAAGCSGRGQTTTPGTITAAPTETTPAISTTPATTFEPSPGQPVEVVSVSGPLLPINPGGPIVEIVLKNSGTQAIINLKSILEIGRDYVFDFGVNPSKKLSAGETVSTRQTLIGGGISDGTAYPLVITGTLENGSAFEVKQQVIIKPKNDDPEISLAPIHEVNITILKSNPEQIEVYIKGGLRDGCTTFNDIEIEREAEKVRLTVTVKHPRGVSCPAIYTWFEKSVNLGSDFIFGTTYTLYVNNYTTTFNLLGSGSVEQAEGVAIYLTRDDVPPSKMEALSHVDIAAEPVVSMQDIVSYDAQTHEIKLSDEGLEKIRTLDVPVSGKSFVVCVNKAAVYWGAFWVDVSSLSFNGITIMKPFGSQQETSIKIGLGYPSPSFYEGSDPRNNQEILQSLEQAGKLINAP